MHLKIVPELKEPLVGYEDNQKFYRVAVEKVGFQDFETKETAETAFHNYKLNNPDVRLVLLEVTQHILEQV